MKGIIKKITAAALGSALSATAALGGGVSALAADNIEYTKTIEGSGDDYTLKLSVTGKDKRQESTSTGTTNGHSDIILVIDATYSMSSTLNDGNTRFSAIQDAAREFVSGLESDAESSISVVSYQCYESNTNTTPVKIEQNRIAADDNGKLSASSAISGIQLISQSYGYDTYYAPPLEKTYTLLNDSAIAENGNNKYVIFFSDGQAADNFTNALNKVKSKATVFSMGVEPKYWYESTDKIKSVASDPDKYFEVGNTSDMTEAFNSALATIKTETSVKKTPMSNVTISDTLSRYVEQNGAATVTASDGSSVNASINATSATINGELKDGVTYTLSIPVKPSQAARDEANAADSATSTFKTNDNATLTYSYGSDTQTLEYAQQPEMTISKESVVNPSDVSFTLTKTLKVNSADKKVPDATFKFSAEASRQDAPEIEIEDITFTSEEVIDSDKKISKEVNVNVPAAADFPEAGTYEYTIKETQNTYTGEGDMTYDGSEYKLTLKLCETTNGLTYDDAGGAHVTLVKTDAPDKKLESVEFNNEFNKEVKTTLLTVSKKVEGEHANKNQSFDFTVSFTDPGNVGDVKPVKDGAEIEYGTDCTFTLKDGENVTFTVPVGTGYTVTEEGTESYEASAVVTSADTQSNSKANAGLELKVSAEAVDGENKADFTNTYVDNPLTGITNGRGPLFIIVPAAAGVVALMAFAGKRRRA